MNANVNEAAGTEPPSGGSFPLKAALIGLIVIAVGVVGFFIWKGVAQDAAAESWDRYHVIRTENEPRQDPLWNDLYGVFAAQRARYMRALEQFLEDEAGEHGDALEPEVRWRLAKTLADHVLAQRDLTDASKRAVHYEKALEQMKSIRDQFPDFQLNWDAFKPDKFPSLTRKFIDWLEKNKEWESKHLPSARDADGDHTVVFRTTAGDVRVRLYAKDAKAWVDGFLAQAIAGKYDGTAVFEKRSIGGEASDPRESSLRGGSTASRDIKDYDTESHIAQVTDPDGGGLLPPETRNTIPHNRGIMAAWHDGASEYDDPMQFLWVVQDSPQLDYAFTPVGKITDEASLETLDRIYGRKTWRTDPKVSQDAGEARKILDFFQAPVRIVSVRVYGKDGKLVQPEPAAADAARSTPNENELELSKLKADLHKKPEPAKPVVKDDKKDDDEGAGDNKGDDGEKKDEDAGNGG